MRHDVHPVDGVDVKALEEELKKDRLKKKRSNKVGGLAKMKSIAAEREEAERTAYLKNAIFQARLPPRLRGNKFVEDPDPTAYRLDRPDRDAIRENDRKARARREVKAKRRRKRRKRRELLKAKQLTLMQQRWKYQNKIDRVERLKAQSKRTQRWDFKKGRVTGLPLFKRYNTQDRATFQEERIRPFSPGHSHHSKATFCLRWGRD